MVSISAGDGQGIYAGDGARAQAADASPVIVLGGPTASGKSRLALLLAERLDGTVINADSMQVYDAVPTLTALPGADDRALVPHRLYGTVPPVVRMTAADWRDLALGEIRSAIAGGRLPIVVGGTGLYLRTLMHGIADIPDIPAVVREAAQGLQQDIGTPALHARLAALDPETAARLKPADTTRVIRAWEVWQATGRSITDWQRSANHNVPTDLAFHPFVLEPPRDRLYAQCDARFGAMLGAGALEEVRALMALGLPPDQPIQKALGVPELSAYLQGEMDLENAAAKARQTTRNFAKRQFTWFRNQLAAAPRIDPGIIVDRIATMKFCDQIIPQIRPKISKSG